MGDWREIAKEFGCATYADRDNGGPVKAMSEEILGLRLQKKLLFDQNVRILSERELWEDEYKNAAKQNHILREALEFYAQQTDLYGEKSSQYNSDYENYRILEDKGTRAREALKTCGEGK